MRGLANRSEGLANRSEGLTNRSEVSGAGLARALSMEVKGWRPGWVGLARPAGRHTNRSKQC